MPFNCTLDQVRGLPLKLAGAWCAMGQLCAIMLQWLMSWRSVSVEEPCSASQLHAFCCCLRPTPASSLCPVRFPFVSAHCCCCCCCR
jgi:hypothetical protein